MDEEVGVAADRRGEVCVEAEVEAVVLVVVRLFVVDGDVFGGHEAGEEFAIHHVEVFGGARGSQPLNTLTQSLCICEIDAL